MTEDKIKEIIRQLLIDELEVEVVHEDVRYRESDYDSHTITIKLSLNGADSPITDIYEDTIYLNIPRA